MGRRITPGRDELLNAERWLMPAADPAAGGRTVALCYPNTYHLGMSNLGFHRLLELFQRHGWAGLRTFLPGATATGLRTFDGDLPLADVDLVAFSVSYEEDYFHVLRMLALAGIPGQASRRGEEHPLVLVGGFAPSLNPEPLARVADVLLLGPAEPTLPPFLRRLDGLLEGAPGRCVPRAELPDSLGNLPGCYVPREDRPPAPMALPRREHRWTAAGQASRLLEDRAAPAPASSRILTPHTEFADRFLVAVGEGCPQGCRFCAASFAVRPPAAWGEEPLQSAVAEGLAATGKIGLVGAAVSDLPCLGALARSVESAGGDLSTSSLRVGALAGGGGSAALPALRTATLAPEAATERMRNVLNKPLSDPEILDAVGECVAAGAVRIRLYLLVGLPGEQEEDADAVVELARRCRERVLQVGRKRGHGAELLLSINPFVPKAATPFQWAPMMETKVLRRRLERIRKGTAGMGGVKSQTGGARLALRQALLSMGDRDAGELLGDEFTGPGWWQRLRRWHDQQGSFLLDERRRDHPFPWDFIDRGVRRSFLWREWQRARAAKATPACDVTACVACGACAGPGLSRPDR